MLSSWAGLVAPVKALLLLVMILSLLHLGARAALVVLIDARSWSVMLPFIRPMCCGSFEASFVARVVDIMPATLLAPLYGGPVRDARRPTTPDNVGSDFALASFLLGLLTGQGRTRSGGVFD